MLSGRKSARARRPWDAWIRDHGDPVRWLLAELAALRAVELPRTADGNVQLAPLALWSLREQLRLEGIEIPQITATKGELRAADWSRSPTACPRPNSRPRSAPG